MAPPRSATVAQSMALSVQQVQRAVLTVVGLPEALAPDARRVPTAARTHGFNSGQAPTLEGQPTNIGNGREYAIFTDTTSPLIGMTDAWECRKFMCVYGMVKYKTFG